MEVGAKRALASPGGPLSPGEQATQHQVRGAPLSEAHVVYYVKAQLVETRRRAAAR